MKTLGVVGGIAPGSTVDYYRLLVADRLEELTEWLAGDGRGHDGSKGTVTG